MQPNNDLTVEQSRDLSEIEHHYRAMPDATREQLMALLRAPSLPNVPAIREQFAANEAQIAALREHCAFSDSRITELTSELYEEHRARLAEVAALREQIAEIERVGQHWFGKATSAAFDLLVAEKQIASLTQPPDTEEWQTLIRLAYADGGDGVMRINRITSEYNRVRDQVKALTTERECYRKESATLAGELQRAIERIDLLTAALPIRVPHGDEAPATKGLPVSGDAPTKEPK